MEILAVRALSIQSLVMNASYKAVNVLHKIFPTRNLYKMYLCDSYNHRKNNCRKIYPAHSMIINRGFVLCDSYFCEKYNMNVRYKPNNLIKCLPYFSKKQLRHKTKPRLVIKPCVGHSFWQLFLWRLYIKKINKVTSHVLFNWYITCYYSNISRVI